MATPYIYLAANRDCSLLGNVPLVLDGGIIAKTISQEHLGAILSYYGKNSGSIDPGRKCILVPSDHSLMTDLTARQAHLCLSFSLNFFSSEGGIVCERAFSSQHVRKFKITEEIEIQSNLLSTSARETKFRIKKGTTPAEIDVMFKLCLIAMKKDKSLTISIDRFTSAILKSDFESQVIDISICLESLLSSSTEISFRFSVYNSILSVSEKEKREEVFSLLRNLYDTRSKIVHGDIPKKINSVKDNWLKIVDVAKLAIAYKLRFHNSTLQDKWDEHLNKLTIGSCERLA